MRGKAIHLARPLVSAIRLPSDSTIDVLKKLVLLLGNLGGFFFSFVLTLLYIYHDLTVPTMVAGIYLVAVALVYVYYFRTKQLNRTAFLFSFLLFLELVVQHIALGGFKSSGVIFIWVAASAIMAMITGQSRLAMLWIISFFVATSIFVFAEPVLAASNPRVPKSLQPALFPEFRIWANVYDIEYILFHVSARSVS